MAKKEVTTDLWVHDLLKEAGIELDAQGSEIKEINEALNVDVVSLFIPIGESLISRKENSSQLKMAIRENVRNYIDEILKEYS